MDRQSLLGKNLSLPLCILHKCDVPIECDNFQPFFSSSFQKIPPGRESGPSMDLQINSGSGMEEITQTVPCKNQRIFDVASMVLLLLLNDC